MTMRALNIAKIAASLCVAALATPAVAEDASKLPASGTVYDKARGELSVGTVAPSRERMVNAVKSASPTGLAAILEYGQRVECFECIPLLEQKLLSSNDAQVREMAAWWLRQRSFGFGAVMTHMRTVATQDADPVRRARAASALGEFLDPHGLPVLQKVVEDEDASVRVAAVRALGRLNAAGGNAALSGALEDANAEVRRAALEQVLRVNFFRDDAAVVARLADESFAARRMAAQIAGELHITDALDPLLGLLMTDDDASVRQAAAIALGRIGGTDARDALADAERTEKDPGVLDAIDVAQRMR